MHLLATPQGAPLVDDGVAIDLAQTPGDVIFLSAADTEIACLAAARARIDDPSFPTVRLANVLSLGHNMSVDLYVDAMVARARLVIVRLLGGRAYWPYGVEQIAGACQEAAIPLAFLPGDDAPDPELARFNTLDARSTHRLWQYCVHGGVDNARNLLAFAANVIGHEAPFREPRPLLRAGLYWPGRSLPDLADLRADWAAGAPVAALVFYRALVQAGNLEAVDALIDGLNDAGLNPLPVYVTGLKDSVAGATVGALFEAARPGIVLNATGFAASTPGEARTPSPLEAASAPILQVVFASGDEETWRKGTSGLSARDIAMNVALPEIDGRIMGRAVAFKGRGRRDPLTEADLLSHRPVGDRVAFVCALARNWTRLSATPRNRRRVALVLANYPNRDGRMGNGVGLDTPASVVNALKALDKAGYRVRGIPTDGDALVRKLAAGATNDFRALSGRRIEETYGADEYARFFARLPDAVRARIQARWGKPADDPAFLERDGGGCFAVPAFRCGSVVVALQPARGYNIDPAASYHDPDLPPPHGYFAFYAWLREAFGAHAIVHFGKHGNLEWLPGKALALAAECFPEAALGPVPHLYPFIVNDPGEGTQAKRRASAVIVDHLTPPMTRAESYGPLRELERLVDEYFEAAGMDPRRIRVLARDILELCRSEGIGADCGIETGDDETAALRKLDGYLCELKEMQIRDGLHIFGESPTGELATDLLVALLRVPRGNEAGAESLHRALARDLGLDFDPLDCEAAAAWSGPRPRALLGGDPWRTAGDTVERLEALASELVSGARRTPKKWRRARAVLGELDRRLRGAVATSGAAEMEGLLTGLDGRFVEPGPSGAPTRGRTDVLPTGRNFFSVDTRMVPTPAAWTLGWKSAGLMVERHMQEHGTWPRAMAITAWGTSNMRTGGDDIAQALALMGVRPTWDVASGRATGTEVIPLSVLDRPRVDVTLRVSGFFRDAFPAQIALFDSAVGAVAALDEPGSGNPLAARVAADAAALSRQGLAPELAARKATYRVFGSMPGAYGAGLQALIDERGWETEADLGRAYIAWGGYAYGAGAEGEPAQSLFEARLGRIDAVVQNQDNREHDLLDSDDYYQFEGGIAAAVSALSGRRPAVYHNDHSRPESPKVRTLEEEVGRVVRARVVNPKWIRGVMRHGYKGAFEMAATVDYMFAFAATAGCVRDHHFDAVFQAYLGDDTVRGFIAEHNPWALKEMSERLLEACERGLWRPRRNDAADRLAELAGDGGGG